MEQAVWHRGQRDMSKIVISGRYAGVLEQLAFWKDVAVPFETELLLYIFSCIFLNYYLFGNHPPWMNQDKTKKGWENRIITVVSEAVLNHWQLICETVGRGATDGGLLLNPENLDTFQQTVSENKASP